MAQGDTRKRHISLKDITVKYDDSTAEAEQSTVVCGP